jgi:alkanesulfonate monooxygenase SsuD/methylene tetrahydromethanopterin reductase-like flavin-dependent oxidoreductase (luciferase family)
MPRSRRSRQSEGAGANSIDVPSLEQTAAWLRQKREEAARRDDTEPGYMIVLKAVGASDGEDDGEWAGRMRAMKNLIQQGREEQDRRGEEQSKQMEQQNTQMEQQNTQIVELKQQLEQQAQQLAAILAAVNPPRR